MAVLNLAINARDAMPGGGALRIRTRRRRADRDPELSPGDYIELAVSDTGAGMSPDVQARAFDPFFTTKGVGKGTGLGLSQVYAVTRQAGGIARIESSTAQGTTITLMLRRTTEEAVHLPRNVEGELGGGEARALALVVDDDAAVRQFLADSLDVLGYAVEQAEDGNAALASLARLSVDVMVIDYAMPGLTGADVALEARERRPDLPIVFASGYADTAAIENVQDSNTAILRKPFRIGELQDAIVKVLRR
jgi:CheY-like chemotaxis protein